MLRLAIGFLLIFGFAALMAWGPVPGGLAGAVFRNNLHEGLDVTALFYTEVDPPSKSAAHP
jgi:hypothetical protein